MTDSHQSFSEETWADSLGDYSEGFLKDVNPFGDTTNALLDDLGLSVRGPGEDLGENIDALGQAQTWGDYAEAGAELVADAAGYLTPGMPGLGLNINEQRTGQEDYIEHGAGEAARYVAEGAEAAYDSAAETASEAWDSVTGLFGSDEP